VGCFYHKNKKPNQYSIKRYDTMNRREMRNIGWVCEKVRKNIFYICTYDNYANKAKVTDLGKKEEHSIFYKNVNISFYVNKDSIGTDYEKAVKALKAIMALI
jgi:hypothetical protein